VGLDFLNLQRVAGCVLAQHHQPLITVEVSKGDVREKVSAKIGLCLSGEGDGSCPDRSQLLNEFDGVRPVPHRANTFSRVEFGTA
jgi:hypothetical protein